MNEVIFGTYLALLIWGLFLPYAAMFSHIMKKGLEPVFTDKDYTTATLLWPIGIPISVLMWILVLVFSLYGRYTK